MLIYLMREMVSLMRVHCERRLHSKIKALVRKWYGNLDYNVGKPRGGCIRLFSFLFWEQQRQGQMASQRFDAGFLGPA